MSAPKKQKLEGGVEHLQKQCLTVLKAIQRKKEAIFFLEPVDWKALNLPLYPTLIKKPMDLGTVERKLQESPCAQNGGGPPMLSTLSSATRTPSTWRALISTALRPHARRHLRPRWPMWIIMASCARARPSTLAATLGGMQEGGQRAQENKNAELFLALSIGKRSGYPIVIKKPMDLGTISSNIEGGKYKSEAVSRPTLTWCGAMR